MVQRGCFNFRGKKVEKVFKEGMGPGVVFSQEATFDVPKKDLKSHMFIKAIFDEEERFLKENIEVLVTEVA